MSGHPAGKGPASAEVHWFTPEEANRALPLVRRIVEDVMADYERLQALRRASEDAGLAGAATSPEAVGASAGSGNGSDSGRSEIDRLITELRGYVQELSELGCHLKDPQRGLVDFHSHLHGRPVFLCWRYGEERVRHWHDLHAGYAGRRPLPAGSLAAPS